MEIKINGQRLDEKIIFDYSDLLIDIEQELKKEVYYIALDTTKKKIIFVLKGDN